MCASPLGWTISEKVIDIKLDGVDHYGKTGWWNGSWLDDNNLKDTEGYWSKVLYTATDPKLLADETKERIKKIQESASSYMSR